MIAAAVYIRQTEKGIAPEIQWAECTLELERRGWRKAAEFVDHESFDGKPSDEWGKMLGAMKAGRFFHLVAYSAERLFRHTKAMPVVFEHAREGGVTLHMIRDKITTEGIDGEDLVRAALVVSRIEASRRSERGSAHWDMRRLRGLTIGRPRHRDPVMERAVYDLLDEGMPVCAVARTLGIGRHKARLLSKERAMAAQE